MTSKFLKISLACLLATLIFITSGCQSEDEKIYKRDFEARKELLKDTPYLNFFTDTLSDEQTRALQFLYAYMPLPDITDYSCLFHINNVNLALRARAEMPWGKTVPDREFMHFVLPLRVNNENLDECREVFFNELKDRVKGLSMYDAVLEVNHWCHEKVTYTPSDSRTSAPLATMSTAHGRCGEESTFTVSALRAVGIPARQVYTPRWAHTDNNHAWVEAWVDGQWYFLGACEPEPVLNLGWFNAPASRAILMHTNVFGHYNGPEEVLNRNACYTEINVTANYAPIATTTVTVVDSDNKAVEGATVEFKIYNYAEYYTAATKTSDSKGQASLTTGCGDMLVWASKDGNFGWAVASAGKDANATIVLDKDAQYTGATDINITPPAPGNNTPQLTQEQIDFNKMRFAYEDSVRNAYVASFPTEESIRKLAKAIDTDPEQTVALIKQSRGNYATMIRFLASCEPQHRQRAMKVLFEMSEKDRRDVPAKVLTDHSSAWFSTTDNSDYYYTYVLNPRVSNEQPTIYRKFFNGMIDADDKAAYKANPELLVKWCRENLTIDQEWNPRRFCMSPMGVWRTRITDPHSRDIFFVAVARSLGIASRIDEVTGKTQYTIDGATWTDVNFDNTAEDAPAAEQGSLTATYAPTAHLDNPLYYIHFTISKIVDGQLMLLNYPETANWDNLLRNGTTLDAGQYMITTGTRMADGSVLSNIHIINITPDTNTVIDLNMRHDNDRLQVIGEFNSESLFHDLATDKQRSLLSATGRGYYILALIDPNSEPSNHFLRDIAPYKEAFETWGQKIVLLFDDKNAASRFKADDFPGLPSTIVMGTDIDGNIGQAIASAMKLENNGRPVIIVADTFNRIVFISQGYSIGLGERLTKIISQLKE